MPVKIIKFELAIAHRKNVTMKNNIGDLNGIAQHPGPHRPASQSPIVRDADFRVGKTLWIMDLMMPIDYQDKVQ